MKPDRPQFVSELCTKAAYKLGKGQWQPVYEMLRRALLGLEQLALTRGFQLKFEEARISDEEMTPYTAVTAMSEAGTEVERGNLQRGVERLQVAITVVKQIAARRGKTLIEPTPEEA